MRAFLIVLLAACAVSVQAVDPRMPLCGCTGGCDALNTAADFSCTDWSFIYEEFANTSNHTSWYDWATTIPIAVPMPFYVYSSAVNLNCTGGGSDFVVANDTPSGILSSTALTQFDAQTCRINFNVSSITSSSKNLYLSLRNLLVGQNATTATLKLKAIKRYAISTFTYHATTGVYSLRLSSICTTFPTTVTVADCNGTTVTVSQTSTAGLYTFNSNCSLSQNTTTPIFFIGAPGLGASLVGANGTATPAADTPCRIPGSLICSDGAFGVFVTSMVVLGVLVLGTVGSVLASWFRSAATVVQVAVKVAEQSTGNPNLDNHLRRRSARRNLQKEQKVPDEEEFDDRKGQ